MNLPVITYDKGCVYMDDDLECENTSAIIIHLMKAIMNFVFTEINLQTDLDLGPTSASLKYLGWILSVERQAVKLPEAKKVKMLTRLDRFSNGSHHVLSNLKKKQP